MNLTVRYNADEVWKPLSNPPLHFWLPFCGKEKKNTNPKKKKKRKKNLNKAKMKLGLCSAEPSHISDVWLSRSAVRKRHISEETSQWYWNKNKTYCKSKNNNKDLGAKDVDLLWNSTDNTTRLPFYRHQHDGKFKKNNTKTNKQKNEKSPDFLLP